MFWQALQCHLLSALFIIPLEAYSTQSTRVIDMLITLVHHDIPYAFDFPIQKFRQSTLLPPQTPRRNTN